MNGVYKEAIQLKRNTFISLIIIITGIALITGCAAETPETPEPEPTGIVYEDPYIGPEDAPVVIVEFSDFLCPYCGKFHQETLPEILETYPDEVQYVHMDFMLMGDASYEALMAANCANLQGKYWEMSDLIFSVYETLDTDELTDHSRAPSTEEIRLFQNNFSDELLRGYAESLNLDMTEYDTCLAEETTGEAVAMDHLAAQQIGIRSIPVFFVNGQPVLGFLTFENFQPFIEDALAEMS